VAIEAGVPVIPATEVLGDDMKAIAKEAEEIGYPLMLKASWGGGGRGMRPINGRKSWRKRSARAGARPRPPSAMARGISRR
jgi:pyruvate carboxylase